MSSELNYDHKQPREYDNTIKNLAIEINDKEFSHESEMLTLVKFQRKTEFKILMTL